MQRSSEVRISSPAGRLQDLIDIHPWAYHLLPASFCPVSYLTPRLDHIHQVRTAVCGAGLSCHIFFKALRRRHYDYIDLLFEGSTSFNFFISGRERSNLLCSCNRGTPKSMSLEMRISLTPNHTRFIASLSQFSSICSSNISKFHCYIP